jgi:GMP synthase (glutamine-hydrolysing)
MRILFVLTEHTAGLTSHRLELYEAARARIATMTEAIVETIPYEDVAAPPRVDALILSGSADPWASHRQQARDGFIEILRACPGPVLGICAGMQMLVQARGGVIGRARQATTGFSEIDVADDTDLLAGLSPRFTAYQSHEDEVVELPPQFRLLASSGTCAVEAIAAEDRQWWGTQFHPEAWDSTHPIGQVIVRRFLELAGMPLVVRKLAADPNQTLASPAEFL